MKNLRDSLAGLWNVFLIRCLSEGGGHGRQEQHEWQEHFGHHFSMPNERERAKGVHCLKQYHIFQSYDSKCQIIKRQRQRNLTREEYKILLWFSPVQAPQIRMCTCALTWAGFKYLLLGGHPPPSPLSASHTPLLCRNVYSFNPLKWLRLLSKGHLGNCAIYC